MSAATDSQTLTSATFGETLFRRAEYEPERTAFTFLADTSHHIETMTYRELHRRAQAIAAALLEQARPGSRALLLFAPGLDYVSAVFGCFQAGIVGVSAPPPQPKRLHRTLPRLLAIAADAEIDAVLTLGAIRDGARSLFDPQDPIAQARWIATDECPDASGFGVARYTLGDAAFLQYTSGSPARGRRKPLLRVAPLQWRLSVCVSRTPGRLPVYRDDGALGRDQRPPESGRRIPRSVSCPLRSPPLR
jgi:acyl-CoA synthetase (AMP-forming)/AMP-acid ligase II